MINQEVDNNVTSAGLEENRHCGRVLLRSLCDNGVIDNELIKGGWTELVRLKSRC